MKRARVRGTGGPAYISRAARRRAGKLAHVKLADQVAEALNQAAYAHGDQDTADVSRETRKRT